MPSRIFWLRSCSNDLINIFATNKILVLIFKIRIILSTSYGGEGGRVIGLTHYYPF